MEIKEMLPNTLTEAQAEGGLVVVSRGQNTTHLSSARTIPYFEVYRERTAVLETPVERIQKAGEDQARRHSKDSQ